MNLNDNVMKVAALLCDRHVTRELPTAASDRRVHGHKLRARPRDRPSIHGVVGGLQQLTERRGLAKAGGYRGRVDDAIQGQAGIC